MAKRHLLNAPHRVKPDFWWYEESRGIDICVEAFDADGCKRVKIFNIPWKSLRAAIYRKDKP